MEKIIWPSQQNLSSLANSFNEKFILNGLPRGRCGYIVSAPSSGKGYLCLSIAYELATRLPILNISPRTEIFKTLYWPIEDGVEMTASRMNKQLSAFNEEYRNLIESNVALWSAVDPIAGSDVELRTTSALRIQQAKEELIEAAMGFDVVIIDTLREACGSADEVRDDIQVKQVLQDIAIRANVAVIGTHHLSKEASKGKERITNVSASGFSRTMANGSVQIALETSIIKNKEVTKVFYTKKNLISSGSDNLNNSIIQWDSYDILNLNSDYLSVKEYASFSMDEDIEVKSDETFENSKYDLSKIEKGFAKKKRTIIRDESILSPESLAKEKQSKDEIGIGQSLRDKWKSSTKK